MTTLEVYRQFASELLDAHSRGDERAQRRFINYHPEFGGPGIGHPPSRPMQPADGELVVAREDRFDDWAALQKFCAETDQSDNRFEDAADAVISGAEDALRRLLDESPELARAHSRRPHHATLLHYSAANGVEDRRQKTPPNAAQIARMLVDTGADINATAGFYGGGPGSTPLVALVTSGHPAQAGVMEDMTRAYASTGQSLEGLDGDGSPIVFALAFRYPTAAHTLGECGAHVTNAAVAAGLGRIDLLGTLLDGNRPPGAEPGALSTVLSRDVTPTQVADQALHFAAMAGEIEAVEYLLDRGVDVNARLKHRLTALHEACWGGHVATVRLLVARGAEVARRDAQFESKPIEWAEWGGHDDVVAFLRSVTPGV